MDQILAKPKRVKELDRATFRTSRLLDFCSQKELTAQTGHAMAEWPVVILKELIDNALDACEEAGISPCIEIRVDDEAIVIKDNGPGMPDDVIADILDFSIRVSSREAYIAPTTYSTALSASVPVPQRADEKSSLRITSSSLWAGAVGNTRSRLSFSDSLPPGNAWQARAARARTVIAIKILKLLYTINLLSK
jgi:hypothetical protein